MNEQTINRGGAAIPAPDGPGGGDILTEAALQTVTDLTRHHRPEIDRLLRVRAERQATVDDGKLPDFLDRTAEIRDSDWTVRGIPEDLKDRRVEITGPVDRKMVVNALNTPVQCYMADFEDSCSPTWEAVVQGQLNLRDAVARQIDFTADNGKEYKLGPDNPVLICRVRGLHLDEKHVSVDGRAVPGAIFDFALYLHHNHARLLANGTGPYFYIPKLESFEEAELWARIMDEAEDRYGLARGTIKATLLIETLPAVFQMHEILWAMRDHIVGLNCGRWDYIFSYIKTLRRHPDRVLPDRHIVHMGQPFLDAYSRLLIQTCHRRGAMAMGGMAAFIPSRDPDENEEILAKVRADKEREAGNGHDGTWIAHPGLTEVAEAVMTRHIESARAHGGNGKNLMHVLRANEVITAEQLLEPCPGDKTEAGMRNNIRVAVQYIESWLGGNGCVPIYGLMEDAATAEISRTSIWQWIQHGCKLDTGATVSAALFRDMLAEELEVIRNEVGEQRFSVGRFGEAAELMEEITTADDCVDFLTLPAYQRLP